MGYVFVSVALSGLLRCMLDVFSWCGFVDGRSLGDGPLFFLYVSPSSVVCIGMANYWCRFLSKVVRGRWMVMFGIALRLFTFPWFEAKTSGRCHGQASNNVHGSSRSSLTSLSLNQAMNVFVFS
ncbi:hypothetical protein BJX61DRAFT_443622 [Aspergillus egyptiacus]|nr:hypothetical protein BJX61DRAFT_443622 [Aspergillus egyptiacus]